MNRLVARALEKETRAVLGKASQTVARWSCPSTAECCQLGTTGKLPWLYAGEWQLMLKELANQKRPLPERRADGGCPFLDAAGKRCSVYEGRPVACRTYFCHRAIGPKEASREEINALFDRLHAAHLARDVEAVPRSLPEWYERERGAAPAGTDGSRFP